MTTCILHGGPSQYPFFMRLLVKEKNSDYKINEFIVLLCSEYWCLIARVDRRWAVSLEVTQKGSHRPMKEDGPVFWVIKSQELEAKHGFFSELEARHEGHLNCLPSFLPQFRRQN